MIHVLSIDADSTPASIRKEFRKKLMTGGAVVRLSETLDSQCLLNLFERFVSEADEHGVCSEVLREIAKAAPEGGELHSRLEATGLRKVLQALKENGISHGT